VLLQDLYVNEEYCLHDINKLIQEVDVEFFDPKNDGIHINEIELDGKPGKIVAVNETACRMLGYSRKEMLKHGPFDFITGYHSRPLEDIIVELFPKEPAVFQTEHRRKDGTIVQVGINAKIVNLRRVRLIISVVRDITGHREPKKNIIL
jgi:PAS domain S-box-containing protein